MDLETLLTELINLPSVTGQEGEIAAFIADHLSARGMIVKRHPVDSDRFNVFAGFEASPPVLLTTHLDTVPPFIPAQRAESRIYGRGACDAKGALAAMVMAALTLEPALQNKIGLLFVVGEETDSAGAKAALQHGMRPKYIINGEPTGNKLARAQKGIFMFRLSARGKAGHSGYPEHGDSAIDQLLQQLHVLKNMSWGQTPTFGEATLNIGTIQGGEAANVIAPAAEALCCLRVVTDCAAIEQRLREALIPAAAYELIGQSDPLELYVPEGFESIVVKYGSDAAHFAKLAQTLMVGPGSILNAHTDNEFISIAELYEAVKVYKQLICTLLTS